MKKPYQKTMYACFIGYIVQAIVNNFVPLLFVTFQTDYRVPLQKITLLITVNFLIQLCVDLLSAGFIDRIGYRASVLLAHGFAAAGLILLTILPDRTADPFVGILLAVVVYALGGGAHLKRRAFCHRTYLFFEPGGWRGSDLKGTVPQQGVLAAHADDAGRRCGGEYR